MDVLRDMLNCFVFVYLVDILIFSLSQTTHVQHIRQVLQRRLDHQLFVKAEKYEFHVSTVSFLGFIVSEGEVKMDLEKVSAVTNWPIPSNWKGRCVLSCLTSRVTRGKNEVTCVERSANRFVVSKILYSTVFARILILHICGFSSPFPTWEP